MDDAEIIRLYNQRQEQAIQETEKKYSSYLYTISNNILNCHEDVSECLSDTYLRAWNTIPPNCPPKLGYYLGRIIRGLSIDRWRAAHSEKRLASEYSVSIQELGECFPSPSSPSPSDEAELCELVASLNAFLGELDKPSRSVFIRRYYFSDRIRDISRMTGYSESKVKSMLHRMRQSLRERLIKEGITI